MIREQNLQVATKPNMAYDAVLTAGNFKPILFSTPMVQAILRGEKTQTRRIINPQPIEDSESGYVFDGKHKSLYKNDSTHEDWRIRFIEDWCKYKIGDILWVRETFAVHEGSVQGSYAYSEGEKVKYPPHFLDKKGIKRCIDFKAEYPKASLKWKPSIFMPKEACRIFLKLTSIRIEKLNDISEADAISEGIERWTEERMKSKPTHYKVYYQNCKPEDLCSYTSCPIDSYETLWQKINGEKSWEENPFVWVYEFKRTDASFACR